MRRWQMARRAWSVLMLAVLIGGGLVVAPAPASAATNYLGVEWDNCSGNLYVRNSAGTYVYIPRNDSNYGVEVLLDGNGYWYWKCGSTGEVSRGSTPWRYRVDYLSVRHATDSREIRWRCYEIV